MEEPKVTSTLKREPLPVSYRFTATGKTRSPGKAWRPYEYVDRDTRACDLMCAGQILYLSGRLSAEDFTYARLNELVSRQPHDVDDGRAIALLLEQGLTCHEITTNDMPAHVENYKSWLVYLGLQDTKEARKAYRLVRPYLERMIALTLQYADQIITERRQPTYDDLDQLVDNGYKVIHPLQSGPTWVINGLVCARKNGFYEVYDPEGSVRHLSRGDLRNAGRDLDFQHLEGWKLPNA